MIQISVIIPTYNRKDSLQNALDALKSQGFPAENFEVIVVDDGSTDGTAQVLASYQHQFSHFTGLEQKNRGPAAARNAGLSRARGAFIAFTDDDCQVDPDWLENIHHLFTTTAAIGIQGRTTTDRAGITPLTHQIDNEHGNQSVPTCNAAYRKDILQQLGGFDETFPYPHNEDADLAWRAMELGEIIFAPNVLVYHPPRVYSFRKGAGRMKILESEFCLYYKNPAHYKKYRAASPWKTIYWDVMVKTQGYYFKSRFKYLHKPPLFAQGLLLSLIWWKDLLFAVPRFVQTDRLYRKHFTGLTT
jgi:glycosyltransferase involved in cell wall biosynthesis